MRFFAVFWWWWARGDDSRTVADLDEAARTREANAVFEIQTEIGETLQGIENFLTVREWEKEREAERAALAESKNTMPSPVRDFLSRKPRNG